MKRVWMLFVAAVFGFSIVFISSCASTGRKSDSDKTGVYTCPMHTDIKKSIPGTCPKCGMNLEKPPFRHAMVQTQKSSETKKETMKDYYTCPMHPEVRSDKPGKCPKCGMSLVKAKPIAEKPRQEKISK